MCQERLELTGAKTEISLRIAEVSDAKRLLDIYAPYVEQTAITFEYQVPSEAEFAGRIRHTLEKFPYIVADQEGAAVGYAYAGPFHAREAYDWAVETSIYVDRSRKRSGIGGQLHQALERALQTQGILNMYACIACPQIPDEFLDRNSIEFHTHLGYRLVGEFRECGYKFDRWYNMVWMEKQIGAHHAGQAAVRPFPDVRRTYIL